MMIFVVFADVVPQFLAEESSICLAHNLQHSSQPIDFRLYFGQLVHKASGVSSTICYKCKRELEKYEKYSQVLEVELKQFRAL